MATNIDKALYSNMSMGIASEEPDIEIEVENPDSMVISGGGITIELEPESESSDDFDANLAEEMDEGAF